MSRRMTKINGEIHWLSAKGPIAISKMTTGHIINCLKNNHDTDEGRILKTEMSKRKIKELKMTYTIISVFVILEG